MTNEAAEAPIRGGGRPDEYPNDWPSTTQITGRWKAPYGLYWWHWEGGKNGYTYNSGYGTKDALDIGQYVHDGIEARIHGQPDPPVPEEHREVVLESLEEWQEVWDGSVKEVVATELPLQSARHKFNGTIDCVVRDHKKRLAIWDWKTAKKLALYTDSVWQVASYKILWDENYLDEIDGTCRIVKIARETGRVAEYRLKGLGPEVELFLLLRKAYDLDKLVAKRAK